MREAGRGPGVERPTAAQAGRAGLGSPLARQHVPALGPPEQPLGVVPWAEPSERMALRSGPWIHMRTESRKVHFVQNGKGETMLWLALPYTGHGGGERSGPGSGRFLGSLRTGPSHPCFRFAWEIQDRICADATLPLYLFSLSVCLSPHLA